VAAVDAAEKGVGRNKGAVPVGARRQLARARQFKVAIHNIILYVFKHKRLLLLVGRLSRAAKTSQVFAVPALLFLLNLIKFAYYIKSFLYL